MHLRCASGVIVEIRYCYSLIVGCLPQAVLSDDGNALGGCVPSGDGVQMEVDLWGEP